MLVDLNKERIRIRDILVKLCVLAVSELDMLICRGALHYLFPVELRAVHIALSSRNCCPYVRVSSAILRSVVPFNTLKHKIWLTG